MSRCFKRAPMRQKASVTPSFRERRAAAWAARAWAETTPVSASRAVTPASRALARRRQGASWSAPESRAWAGA